MNYRIAHLSSVHPSFDTRIFGKECASLVDAGYSVCLIVQHERDEVLNGIEIKALEKPSNRFERMFKLMWRVYQRAKAEKADLYHFHDPELIFVGLMLAFSGHKVIYDSHENTPAQILDKEWLNPLLRWPLSKALSVLERFAVTWFSAVVVATPSIACRFPENKRVIVQNFPIIGELDKSTTEIAYSERPKAITFTGALTVGRGAREMVSAVKIVAEKQEIRLILVGYVWPDSLMAELEQSNGWSQVDFLGWQNREQLADLFGTLRAGLVLFHPLANHIDAQPNKLFEYMSAGLPVIASDFPLWREIIDSSGCGLLVDPFDTEKIAEAITWILDHPEEAEAMGERGREAVHSKYNWASESAKLLEIYRRILA